MQSYHFVSPVLLAAITIASSTIPLAGISRPAFASSSEFSSQELATPNRRKPGGTRSDIVMPNRRKPGGTRSDIAMPNRRKPGSARPLYSCPSEQAQLTALIPQNLKGLTSRAAPELFFYMPALAQETEVELVVRDSKDRLVYEKSFRGNDQAGILKLSLPPTLAVPSSNGSEEYHWYLSIVCNAGDRAYDVVVEGLVERVNLPSESLAQISNLDLAQRVNFYQHHQLWQDVLAALVQSKTTGQMTPESTALWQRILQSADLDPKLAQEPILSLPPAQP